MTPEPAVLLDTSIAQLRTLASFLAEQMGTASERKRASPEARACKEILLSISVLLPKLQAAKHVLPAASEDEAASEGTIPQAGTDGRAHCAGCEE